ncbi:MAG: hypothetical protein P9M14_14845 [Candidatus Alcyoniella australis]|nr:hypothetical protein [Candidatus Alcyoniella australis]
MSLRLAKKRMAEIKDDIQRDQDAQEQAFQAAIKWWLRKVGFYATIGAVAVVAIMLLLLIPPALRSAFPVDIERFDEADRVYIDGFAMEDDGNIAVYVGVHNHVGQLGVFSGEDCTVVVKDNISGALIEKPAVLIDQPDGRRLIEVRDPFLKVLHEGPADVSVQLVGPQIKSNLARCYEIVFG